MGLMSPFCWVYGCVVNVLCRYEGPWVGPVGERLGKNNGTAETPLPSPSELFHIVCNIHVHFRLKTLNLSCKKMH